MVSCWDNFATLGEEMCINEDSVRRSLRFWGFAVFNPLLTKVGGHTSVSQRLRACGVSCVCVSVLWHGVDLAYFVLLCSTSIRTRDVSVLAQDVIQDMFSPSPWVW